MHGDRQFGPAGRIVKPEAVGVSVDWAFGPNPTGDSDEMAGGYRHGRGCDTECGPASEWFRGAARVESQRAPSVPDAFVGDHQSDRLDVFVPRGVRPAGASQVIETFEVAPGESVG